MNIKKRTAVVDILGGFGNQLFQFAFANTLRKEGFDVFINLYNFKRVEKEKNSIITNRDLVLPLEFFNLEELTFSNFIKYDLIDKLKLSKLKILRRNQTFNNYFSWFNDKNVRLDSTSKKNRFTGYWQTLDNLEANKVFLINSLKKEALFMEALNYKGVNGSTSLHIRRGDYLLISENLNDDYYIKAIEYAKNNIEDFHYEIFTDDVDWVKKNKIFKDAIKIHPFENTRENTKVSFANLLKNENFIISNSSFSLLAAFLKENDNSKILFPEPWFKYQDSPCLSKKNWIPIINN